MCRATATFGKSECDDNQHYLPLPVEVTTVPSSLSRGTQRLWVLQDCKEGQSMTDFATGAMRAMGAVHAKLEKERVVANLVEDEASHVVVHCPVFDRRLGMGLTTAASMVGVMMGVPIRSNVALMGWINGCGSVFSTSDMLASLTTDVVRAMRKREARIEHLYVGAPERAAVSALEELRGRIDDLAKEETGAPQIYVIEDMRQLIEEEHRFNVYGEPWPVRLSREKKIRTREEEAVKRRRLESIKDQRANLQEMREAVSRGELLG